MQRKLLEDMGLTKEQVDQIMAENGKDITREQGVANTYKTQLGEAQDKLKAFDGVDVADLKNKITTLTNDIATTKSTCEGQIADINFMHSLESKVGSMKARNAKAVMALLDIDTLKKSKNQDADITTALEAIKKDNDYLFDLGSVPGARTPQIVSGTNTDGSQQASKGNSAANAAIRSLCGVTTQ